MYIELKIILLLNNKLQIKMSDPLSKDIYDTIHDWENSLAPLSDFQRNTILDLSDEISQLLLEVSFKVCYG